MAQNFPAEIVDLLLAQVSVEFGNSQVYLAASFYFADKNFEGIASYLRVESENERRHGLKIADFIIKRDKQVTLQTLVCFTSIKWLGDWDLNRNRKTIIVLEDYNSGTRIEMKSIQKLQIFNDFY